MCHLCLYTGIIGLWAKIFLQWKRNKEVVRVKSRRGKKRRKEDMFSDGELEELAKEARLLKKFKAGKVG